MKNLFVIGDVHGCLETLNALLRRWDKNDEQLVFVGDLIDRGNFSPQTVDYVQTLQIEFPDTIVLMGNHEYAAIQYVRIENAPIWFNQMGEKTVKQYHESNFNLEKHIEWFETFPQLWENEFVAISHAGIGYTKDVFDKEDRQNSVLWTRKPLKNIGKIQIHGHTPKKEGPIFTSESNSYNIDSACVYKERLTALKFDVKYKQVSFVQEEVHDLDIQ